jgi:hypothetical protein
MSAQMNICAFYLFVVFIFYVEPLEEKDMSRLSIELTPEQHQKIKAMAALTGTSIREYVVARLLPPSSDEELALQELETLLNKRIESAKAGQVSGRSVRDIFQEAYQETQP